jgi:hypothetical protein
VVQKTDPGGLRRRLPLGGERRGEEAACDHSNECSTVHYSITWSARTGESLRFLPRPVSEDEATRVAFPHLVRGGGVSRARDSPNSNVAARATRTPRPVVAHAPHYSIT